MSKMLLAVLIRESSILVGQIDVENGKFNCVEYNSYNINNWASANELIKQWANAVRDFAEDKDVHALYIAMPGPFDYDAGISYMQDNRNLKTIYAKNVKAMLAAEMGLAEDKLYFYNDAVSALAAEEFFRGFDNQSVLLLYFDEGFGSAWLKDGKITDGQLWDQGFLEGKVEDYFSLKWLRKTYHSFTGLSIADIRDVNVYASLCGKELFRMFAANLATYLRQLSIHHSIHTVVLAGAMLPEKEKLLAPLQKRLVAMGLNLKLIRSSLGDSEMLYGVASLQHNDDKS